MMTGGFCLVLQQVDVLKGTNPDRVIVEETERSEWGNWRSSPTHTQAKVIAKSSYDQRTHLANCVDGREAKPCLLRKRISPKKKKVGGTRHV